MAGASTTGRSSGFKPAVLRSRLMASNLQLIMLGSNPDDTYQRVRVVFFLYSKY